MNPDFSKLPSHVKRRIEFLIQEALNKSPRDQVITFCMRVLSNYASIGMDAGSYKVKITNQMVSRRAEILLNQSTSLKEWAAGCINEHEVPLKEVWNSLCSSGPNLRPEEVWSKFYSSKMVTITKEEDQNLSSQGLKSNSNNFSRYIKSGIEVIQLKNSPQFLFEIGKNQKFK
jgi:hypothetical protein